MIVNRCDGLGIIRSPPTPKNRSRLVSGSTHNSLSGARSGADFWALRAVGATAVLRAGLEVDASAPTTTIATSGRVLECMSISCSGPHPRQDAARRRRGLESADIRPTSWARRDLLRGSRLRHTTRRPWI